ncbi:MAG TPA: BlaI/MecI/CopY family transcriptional regulator [Chthonomonadaceae bacterium]|nr:BlaI/MecI/CopY family transcriptional regulator [Chthonomonadaceae bacterium]
MRSPLGELELEVLRYIAERRALTVGEVTEGFGVPRHLARTTVQTVMERLWKKGYLVREQQPGVYRYSAQEAQESVLRGLVHDFVEKTLAGSLSPFVAYLSETQEVSPQEFEELQKLVARLEAQRKEQEK